jgi:hypothetical protein
MVEILGKQIPNQLNELTIQQFEDITDIHNDSSLDIIEKHIKVFELLGVSEDEMVEQDVDFETFKKYVQEFNQKTDAEIIKEVEIDGYTYKAYEEEFKLSVKDMKVIEKIINSKHKGYLSELIAVLFKRTDLSKIEHYDKAHIKHKSKIFREEKAALAVPYLVHIGNKFSKQIENESTEVVE